MLIMMMNVLIMMNVMMMMVIFVGRDAGDHPHNGIFAHEQQAGFRFKIWRYKIGPIKFIIFKFFRVSGGFRSLNKISEI